MALAFAATNGLHDAANASATLVATRVANPGAALALAAVCTLAGPLLFGAAVAHTVAGILQVEPGAVLAVVGAALTGACVWNLATWLRGLPASPSHALVGGLVGAAVAHAGASAVDWGGIDGLRPVGVAGVLAGLVVAPMLGFAVAAAGAVIVPRALRRASVRVGGPVRGGQWAGSAVVALTQGANDAQKSIGLAAALLIADGRVAGPGPPEWTVVACAAALTLGISAGGTRIVRTLGLRITRLRPLDGLVTQVGSAVAILVASLLGAPVSTTQVVASSVVGAGVGHGRIRHIRWDVVKAIGLSWVATLPAAALMAAAAFPLWRWIA